MTGYVASTLSVEKQLIFGIDLTQTGFRVCILDIANGLSNQRNFQPISSVVKDLESDENVKMSERNRKKKDLIKALKLEGASELVKQDVVP